MNDWMKNVPDETLLSEINIPGTHNSATRFVQFSYFSKCQELSVFEQLNIGIRFLDLRVEKKGEKLCLVHASAKCRKSASDKALLLLEDVISDCECFLKNNPSETLIVSIKRDAGKSSQDTFDTLFENYLENDLWYKENRIPILKEVRGKMVFFNRFDIKNKPKKYDDTNTGLNFSNWPDQSKYIGVTHLQTSMDRRDGQHSLPVFIQDWYKLSPKNKWEKALAPTLAKAPCKDEIFITFFSTGNILNNPKKCSKYIIKRFMKTELESLGKYGWMLFDFPTEKVCRKVVLTNF